MSGRICTGPPPERGAAAEAFSFGNDFDLFLFKHPALLLLLRASLMFHLKPQLAAVSSSLCLLSGEQIQSQVRGLVLLDATVPQQWERVVQLSFGPRPGTPPTHHIFFEVMGRCITFLLANCFAAELCTFILHCLACIKPFCCCCLSPGNATQHACNPVILFPL